MGIWAFICNITNMINLVTALLIESQSYIYAAYKPLIDALKSMGLI